MITMEMDGQVPAICLKTDFQSFKLGCNFGDYVALVDDTSAFPGEKSQDMFGNDPSGHALVGGGSI